MKWPLQHCWFSVLLWFDCIQLSCWISGQWWHEVCKNLTFLVSIRKTNKVQVVVLFYWAYCDGNGSVFHFDVQSRYIIRNCQTKQLCRLVNDVCESNSQLWDIITLTVFVDCLAVVLWRSHLQKAVLLIWMSVIWLMIWIRWNQYTLISDMD